MSTVKTIRFSYHSTIFGVTFGLLEWIYGSWRRLSDDSWRRLRDDSWRRQSNDSWRRQSNDSWRRQSNDSWRRLSNNSLRRLSNDSLRRLSDDSSRWLSNGSWRRLSNGSTRRLSDVSYTETAVVVHEFSVDVGDCDEAHHPRVSLHTIEDSRECTARLQVPSPICAGHDLHHQTLAVSAM